MHRIQFPIPALLLTLVLAHNAMAQSAKQTEDVSALTVQRIYADKEFKTESFGPTAWLDDGVSYTTLESVEDEQRAEAEGPREQEEKANDEPEPPKQLVRYETASGERSNLVSLEQLTPATADEPLIIEGYRWSEDKSKLLIFTNTVKVWRDNTRGDYWVLDLEAQTLRRVASGAAASTLMFAKFSPQADRVAYVRENNIYVETLLTGETVPIASDGTKTLINGTFDWVYEEELGLQDGFRFSPDGQHIAYWQLDSDGIREFAIINNTDALYPQLTRIPYPKVGTRNSSARIGVVPAGGGETTWMQVPGDPRNNYLASMEWVADSSHLLIEQLNRRQNERTLYSAGIDGGQVDEVFVDRDDAWIDLRSKFDGYESDTHRLILSESDGWRHVYQVSLADRSLRQLTRGPYDVIALVGADQAGDWLYFTASPENPTQRYLYRVAMHGKGQARRVTPRGHDGQHDYNVAPNGQSAIHTYSAMGRPPLIDLVALPSHESLRVLEDNSEVREKLAQLEAGTHDFFRVEIETPENSALAIDGWIIKPPGFDAAKKYPVVFYVYSEPAGQTTRDVWGGDRYLWHLMLSQRGYLVATLDNRGTPAPRGREWRKAIHGKIGIVNVADQAAATRKVLAWPFVDDSRVGVWGWSGGGSMTLNAMFQHPDLYHVGLSVAPVGDQLLYDTIYQERYMGLPDDNPDGFERGSPVTHARNLQGKLLLVHGTGDDNVHYQNAERIINELIEHDLPFDMMSYPNRTHSIREGKNTRSHLYALLTRYLTTHLPAGGR